MKQILLRMLLAVVSLVLKGCVKYNDIGRCKLGSSFVETNFSEVIIAQTICAQIVFDSNFISILC